MSSFKKTCYKFCYPYIDIQLRSFMIKVSCITLKSLIPIKKTFKQHISIDPKVILRDIYPSNSTVSGGTTVKNSKHNTKVFSLDKTASYGNYHNCRSDYFQSNEVDLDNGGVYVIVDKFFWGKTVDSSSHPQSLVDNVKALEECGIDVPEIYALKSTVATIECGFSIFLRCKFIYLNKI